MVLAMTIIIDIAFYGFCLFMFAFAVIAGYVIAYFCITSDPNAPSELHSRDRYQVAEDYANEKAYELSRKINHEALKFDDEESQIFLQP